MAGSSLTTARARTLFAPLEAGGRAETVTRQLTRAIALGLLLDGERLPSEIDLATQLGVSTVTLRDALATLRSLGLVETRRGRGGGSFVRAPSEPRAGGREHPLVLISLHELRDIGDHRSAIAGTAAKLAAERALDGDLGTLHELVLRLVVAETVTERRQTDARIHIEIAAAAQSPRLVRAEMELWSEIGDLLWLPMPDGDVAGVVGEHGMLVDAIEAREAGRARELAEQHVLAETGRLLELRIGLGGR